VLQAINDRKAEDHRLCAFVALHGSEWKKREAKATKRRVTPRARSPKGT
jgi:hypothetical protein